MARKSKKITRRKETPNCVEISGFSEIELSDDGNAIIVSARLADSAEPTKYAVPYTSAVWLAKAILSVAHTAVERQAASGAIQPSHIVGDALEADALEVIVKPRDDRAGIVAVGTWTSNGAPGTTTLLVRSSAAQVLIDQLRPFLEMVQTLSRPS